MWVVFYITFLLYQLGILMSVNGTFTSVFIAKFCQKHVFTKEQYVILYTIHKLIVIQVNLTVASHSQNFF